MSILGKWVFGTNGHVETGTNGCGTGTNGILGPMSIEASKHWGNWAPEKIGVLGNIGTLWQMVGTKGH